MSRRIERRILRFVGQVLLLEIEGRFGLSFFWGVVVAGFCCRDMTKISFVCIVFVLASSSSKTGDDFCSAKKSDTGRVVRLRLLLPVKSAVAVAVVRMKLRLLRLVKSGRQLRLLRC